MGKLIHSSYTCSNTSIILKKNTKKKNGVSKLPCTNIFRYVSAVAVQGSAYAHASDWSTNLDSLSNIK